MNLALRYVDVDDVLDAIFWIAIAVLLLEWFAQTTETGAVHTPAATGDGALLLTDREYEHLADGGTIEVDRWHGGTLVIEAYQTVADGGEPD